MDNHIPGSRTFTFRVPAYPPRCAAGRTDPANHTIVRISHPAEDLPTVAPMTNEQIINY
ncbi:hypothetical protein [Actinokineospora cianjurensis]|uniref:hypothetical protein n=1 Tax=Actinokineospora cianjurensis TaxID=585224 RepID=UPI001476B145|nr:hypothetical protein [Actinokineospora cianjurensis]